MPAQKISEIPTKSYSPLLAIRKYCLWCMGDNFKEIELCPSKNECVLYPYRFGKRSEGVQYSRLKIIREKCHNCAGFDNARIKRCEFKNCSLWIYRMGHNPKLVGKRGKGDPNFRNTISTKKTANQHRDKVH